MITNSASVRASTAALIRSTISASDTISLPGRCPQRFVPTWSSMWTAATPACSMLRIVRAMLNAPPHPVSISTSSGSEGRIHNPPRVGQHILHRADAQVRQSQRVRRHAATRQIQRPEARSLRHPPRKRRNCARHLQRFLLRHRQPKLRPRTRQSCLRQPIAILRDPLNRLNSKLQTANSKLTNPAFLHPPTHHPRPIQ